MADTGAAERVTGSAADERQAAVVIAGAGPVGLMLAIELSLARIQPIVLERLTEISEVLKGDGPIRAHRAGPRLSRPA